MKTYSYTHQHKAIALYTLARKETLRILRIWPQTLIPPAITTMLYFLIFGHIIGNRIDNIKGFTYAEYIVPGLILMAVINNSYANVVTSFFSSKFQRFIEELLISPMSHLSILMGYTLGGVLRGLMVGTVVILISLLFTTLHIAHAGLMIFVWLMTSVLFSLCGLINGLFAKTFDDTALIPTFLLTPLTYLGGVFFSVDALPHWGQKLAFLNPIFYQMNAFRYTLLGIEEVNVTHSITLLVVLTVGLFMLALYLLNKGVGIRN